MTRVLIADNHPVVRKGVKNILADEFPDIVCGEANSGPEALEQVERHEWDLVILDITMPGQSGLDVLKQIKERRPKLPALVLSIHPEAQYGKRAFVAGASGYVNKESAPDELVQAVRQILAGRMYVSRDMAENLAAHVKPGSDRPPHESLSDREFEILRLIGSGKNTIRIAGQLHLSATTVSTYRARILTKMNMKTTAELMHYALQNDLV